MSHRGSYWKIPELFWREVEKNFWKRSIQKSLLTSDKESDFLHNIAEVRDGGEGTI